MGAPKEVDDFFVRNYLGIVFDLHHLGMAALPAADLFVGGIWFGAASVSRDYGKDAWLFLVDGFDAPEASASEGSFRGYFHSGFFGEGRRGEEDQKKAAGDFHSVFSAATNLSETELTQ